MKPGDHYQMLLREFTNVGIKPEVSKTNGGHLRFAFEAAGAKDSIVTSFTPSDHRSTLNARALVRRKLRAAGIYEQTPVQPLPLEKALEVPSGVDPVTIRVAQLERDLGVVLELIHEIGEEAAKVAFKVGWRAHAETVQKAIAHLGTEPPVQSMAEAVATKPTAPPVAMQVVGTAPQKPARKRRRAEQIMAKMHYDKWLTVGEIAKDCGVPNNIISVALTPLRKAHLVDNQDGKWRLRAPSLVNASGRTNGHQPKASPPSSS
jgi:hypothetical protein